MQDKQKITLLRICYWAGAALDAAAAVQLLLPDFWLASYGFKSVEAGPGLNAALLSAAVLMLGWTVLLIWADRNPVERKGIMLITLFPVVTGLTLLNLYGVATGVMAVEKTVPVLAMQLFIGTLYAFGYYQARGLTAGSSEPL